MHVRCKANVNCLEMKPTPCIFQTNLNLSESVGWSENLIQLNSSKSKSIKALVFHRTNKDVWVEKRTTIGNLEIVSAVIPIEFRNIEVNDKTFKENQKENFHIQTCSNENKFLPGVDLSHLPNDRRKKVEKLLVREYKLFSKDEKSVI